MSYEFSLAEMIDDYLSSANSLQTRIDELTEQIRQERGYKQKLVLEKRREVLYAECTELRTSADEMRRILERTASSRSVA